MPPRLLRSLRVMTALGGKGAGRLVAGQIMMRCALGPGGIIARKREGDNATPLGRFALLRGYFRAERLARFGPLHRLTPLRPDDGWCDAPGHARYNRPVRLPFAHRHERMWQGEFAYDVVIVLDHNQRPRVMGLGSAVFFHLAQPDYAPTAGCVAISLADMRRLLPRLAQRALMRIG